ncbi:unnamed protein product [Pleuronectes platessa]|uniref:SEC7 domain-containing protein n=1 Tax=Pleuronectes platessa TaxID=8262 RepID=A0A9N7UNU6_PLEPL|nr:unnamed protein product [Pleuronectes platessa]
MPAPDNTDPHQPEDSVLQSLSHSSELPRAPSRFHRPSHPPTEFCSPVRDPRLLQAELRSPDTPTLHRRLPPQYTGDSWSTVLDRTEDLSCFEKGDCTELARRLFINQSVEEAPVSWTSRQQWGDHVKNSPRPSSEPGLGPNDDKPPDGQSIQRRRPLSPTAQQKRAEQRRREILLLGPVVLDSPEEDEGCDEEGDGHDVEGYEAGQQPGLQRMEEPPEAEQNGGMGGSSSRSSSGVTGSLGDRDCVSPESSQSSHQSNETGAATSGIQTDSGCTGPVPSLHCQRIARAKWEFLFGTTAEEAAGGGEKNSLENSTAPPSGNSSESPTPTPPSSLPLLSANHEVQDVEVELVTPPPAIMGSSPKTGIIGRTLKYSETDLDAVPLRCYRETDIDELLLAEQEDTDSAFGSNRSVQGTPGPGSSPLGGLAYGRTDGEEVEDRRGRRGEEEEEEDEEEEEEEEEEMVSWASVRMQGDTRKQQFAAQEDPDVFGHLLQRPMETFFDNHHPALKSPILVSGPRCAAEDTFSRHFESIMESHRAKGTSYNSLDSEELLTSSTQTVLTFDLPTLTPAIHGVVCHSARQIVKLSFAPLAHDERPSLSDSVFTVTGDSDATRAPSSERLSSGSEDTPPRGRECAQLGSSWYSNTSVSLPRRQAETWWINKEFSVDEQEQATVSSVRTENLKSSENSRDCKVKSFEWSSRPEEELCCSAALKWLPGVTLLSDRQEPLQTQRLTESRRRVGRPVPRGRGEASAVNSTRQRPQPLAPGLVLRPPGCYGEQAAHTRNKVDYKQPVALSGVIGDAHTEIERSEWRPARRGEGRLLGNRQAEFHAKRPIQGYDSRRRGRGSRGGSRGGRRGVPQGTEMRTPSVFCCQGASAGGEERYLTVRRSCHSRDKARLATDSELDQDLSERLGLSSSDTLTNGSHRADVAAARRLAKRLFNLDGFRKSDVARHLSKNNDFSRMVAEEYLSFFNFTGLALDQSLRTFLRQFA